MLHGTRVASDGSLLDMQLGNSPHAGASAADLITVPDPDLLFNGEYKRVGNDLKIVGEDGKSFLVPDYFAGDKRPGLLSPKGSLISGDIVEALAGPLAPGQYAQATAPQSDNQPIGRVVTVSGNVTAIRNGVAIALNANDALLKGDVLQTASNGQLAVIFNDGSTFNLTASARMVLDEFVYDPNGTANSSVFNLIRGQVNFISGAIAQQGDMKITTPVATMGIRGTVGIAAMGDTLTLSVADQGDGRIHAIDIRDLSGNLVGRATSVGGQWTVATTAPLQAFAQESTRQLDRAAELQIVQQLLNLQSTGALILQQLQQDQQKDPDPKSTNGSGSSTLFDVKTQKDESGNIIVTGVEKKEIVTNGETKTITVVQDIALTQNEIVIANPAPLFLSGGIFTRLGILDGPGSAAAQGNTEPAAIHGIAPDISADGRLLVYESAFFLPTQDPTGGDGHGPQGDIYLYDRLTGEKKILTAQIAGAPQDATFEGVSISLDGRFVVFQSHYQVTDTFGTHSQSDVYLYNALTGGVQLLRGSSGNAHIDGVGHFIAMEGRGAENDPYLDVVVVDQNGALIFDISGNDNAVWSPEINADGRYITFWSGASDISVNGVTLFDTIGTGNGVAQVFVYDRLSGDLTLVSTAGGMPGDANSGALGADANHVEEDWTSAIWSNPDNPNHYKVVFQSSASNLVADDDNDAADVFVYDSATGTIERVSVRVTYSLDANGAPVTTTTQADGDSYRPVISPDGRYVIFGSNAANLAAGDTNSQPDTFIYDLATATIQRVSTNAFGHQSLAHASLGAAISIGGNFAAFGGIAIAFEDGPPPQLLSDGRIKLVGGALSDLVPGDGNLTMTLHVSHGTLAPAATIAGATAVSQDNGNTLVITGSVAAISAAVQTGVIYTPTGAGNDAMTVQVVDPGGASYSTSVGFAPDGTEIAPLAFVGGQTLVQGNGIKFFGSALTSLDPTDQPVTLVISAAHGSLTPVNGDIDGITIVGGQDGGNGTLIITGSLTAINDALLSGVIYAPDNPGFSTDVLTMAANDGYMQSGQDLSFDNVSAVFAVNTFEAPIVVSDIYLVDRSTGATGALLDDPAALALADHDLSFGPQIGEATVWIDPTQLNHDTIPVMQKWGLVLDVPDDQSVLNSASLKVASAGGTFGATFFKIALYEWDANAAAPVGAAIYTSGAQSLLLPGGLKNTSLTSFSFQSLGIALDADKDYIFQIIGDGDVGIATATGNSDGRVWRQDGGGAWQAIGNAGQPVGLFADFDFAPALTTRGTLPFTDIADTHEVSVGLPVDALGAVTVDQPWGNLIAWISTDTTGANTAGQISWAYAIDPLLAAQLPIGATHIDTFRITLTDSGGGQAIRDITVTVIGTNERPQIIGPAASASYTEDGAATFAADGSFDFTDFSAASVDLPDTHTVAAALTDTDWTAANAAALDADLVPLATKAAATAALTAPPLPDPDSTDGATGQVHWHFAFGNQFVQFLAAGEKLTLTYDVLITDSHFATDGKPDDVVVTITGVNDEPIIGAAIDAGGVTERADGAENENIGELTAQGTIAFTDVDLTNTHTVSKMLVSATDSATSASTAERGTFTPSISDDATGDGAGVVTWDYTIAAGALDDLAEGQTITQVYDVTITDFSGATDTQTVTLTLTGTNDAPVFGASGDNLIVNGSFETPPGEFGWIVNRFAPADFGGWSIVQDGIQQVGEPYWQASDGDFSIQLLVAGVNRHGAIEQSFATQAGLQYRVDFDYTANWAGGGVTHVTRVSADGQSQDHSIVRTNGPFNNNNLGYEPRSFTFVANDTSATLRLETLSNNLYGPIIDNVWVTAVGGVGTTAGGVTERADGAENENTDDLTAQGTIDFTDVDLTNTHEVTVTPISATDSATNDLTDARGTLVANVTEPSTGDGAGVVTWDFAVAAGALDDLAEGQTITQVYTVTITDSSGATDIQSVTLTLTGTNDAPVAVADDNANNPVVEAGGVANGTPGDPFASGNVLANDTDVDAGDSKTLVAVDGLAVGGSLIGGIFVFNVDFDGTYGMLEVNTDGDWFYTLDDADPDTDALTQGQTVVDVFDYTMRDAAGATSFSTLTIDIAGTNDAPVAVADDNANNPVVEAGGVANGTPGDPFASGNVLANDTDVDAGDSKTLVAVDGLAVGGSLIGGIFVFNVDFDGTYGMLEVNTDGDWFYTLDDADPDTDALTQGQTVVDVFDYTMRDAAGATSFSTLTIDIAGTNDAPVAVADDNANNPVVEAGGVANGTPGDPFASGNVLANDTDVDAGDSKTLVAVDGLAVGGSLIGGIFVFNVDFDGTYGMLEVNTDGDWFYTLDDADPDTDALTQGQTVVDVFDYTMRDAAGATSFSTLTIDIAGTNDAPVAVADDNANNPVVEAGGVANGTPGDPFASGNVLANDTDVDAGDSKTLVAVDGLAVGGSLIGGIFVFNVDFDGTYGMLEVNTDGDWFYTLDDADPDTDALTQGQTVVDVFDYTMRDAAGATSFSTLTIDIAGTNDAPVAVADDNANNPVVEAGGVANGTPGDPFASGNVLANDTDVDAGDSKTLVAVDGLAVGGSLIGGIFVFNVDFDGTYGMLEVNTDGDWFYTLDDADPDTDALTQGQTVVDVFDYTMRDAAGATSFSTLTIDIAGTNDAPVAVADDNANNPVVEAGGVANGTPGDPFASGNVLANDTDVDAGDSKTLVAVDGLAVGGSLIGGIFVFNVDFDGTYGMLEVNTDGDWFYTLDDADPDTDALTQGQTVVDVFDYTMRDAAGATSFSTLTIDIAGTNDAPVAVADDNANNPVVEAGGVANGTPGDPFASGNVLANDTDVDAGDSKTLVAVDGLAVGGSLIGGIFVFNVDFDGTYGMLEVNTDGDWFYTLDDADPDTDALTQGQTVVDVFDYTMRDAAGATSFSTLTIDIAGTNDAPVAVADDNANNPVVEAGGVANGTPGDPFASGNVLANDTDVDAGDSKTLVAVDGLAVGGSLIGGIFVFNVDFDGTYGMLEVNTDGDWFYTLDDADPDTDALTQGQTVVDVFDYTMRDAAGATSFSTLTIDIAGTNDAPVAVADDNANNPVVEAGGVAITSFANVSLDDVALGAGGFKIIGETGSDFAGGSVSGLGDVNGDGRADLLVGARGNDAGGSSSGAAYVVFGKADGAAVDLDSVTLGIGGFKIIGENASDLAGTVSGLGDVNGDGRADLLVGALGNGAGGSNAGAAYVVFGKADGAAVNLDSVTLGIGGFKIVGETGANTAGASVSGLGDVNGDGRADLLVGAPGNDGGSGAAYVVFGKADGAAVDLDTIAAIGATGGFKISGENGGDQAGNSVSGLGDVNGDGRADLLVGALGNDAGGSNAGAAYVVFGKAGGTALNLDNVALGIGGFKIVGENANDLAGISVSGLGDVNGDGRADLLVGAYRSDAGGGDSGAAYVVFGKADGAAVDLDSVALGVGGFKIVGENVGDGTGVSVSGLGDVNGDGRADLLVGASDNDAGGSNAGAAYVVFGKADGAAVDLDNVTLGIGGFRIAGENAGDQAGMSVSGLGDVNGDGRADLLVGASFNDAGGADSGAAYVVFGPAAAAAPSAGDPLAAGNVLTNDTDVDAGDTKTVSAVNGSAANVDVAVTGTYGSLTLHAGGDWTYALNNADPDTQALAQGQAASDVFNYTMRDTAGATSSSTLSIDITGTNDAPVISGGPVNAGVTEDAAGTSTTITGQLTANDVDQGATQTWKVDGGTDAHAADYNFAIDNLKIVRNGETIVEDAFTSAPATGDGSYTVGVSGTPGTLTAGLDANGRSVVFLDAAHALATTGIGSTTPFVANNATRLTGTDDGGGGTTLHKSLDFSVEGRFDLVLPNDLNEAYGIRLTDRQAGVAVGGTTGNDGVDLRVAKSATHGAIQVQFRAINFQENGGLGQITPLQTINLSLGPPLNLYVPAGEQIVLRLAHSAGSGNISASFDIVGFDGITIHTANYASTGSFTAQGSLFSDENWTQAQFHASSPATNNSYLTTDHGTFSVSSSGDYTYGLLNGTNGFGPLPVQQLAAGETVADDFTVRVTDDQGASATTAANINVTGINDRPVVDLNGAAPGNGATLSYVENNAAARIAPTATLVDIDSANLNGGSLTVSFSANGASEDQLSIKNGGMDGAVANPITLSGADVRYNDNVIGSFSGGANGSNLVVAFTTDDATPAAVRTLASHILYSNTSDAPSTLPRSVLFSVNDGDGIANGGANIGIATATINVAAVNDAPILNASATLSFPAVDEDSGPPSGEVGVLLSDLVDLTSVADGLDNVTDPDAASIGVAIVDVDETNGTLWYSANNGDTWVTYGSVSESNAPLVPANSRLYFQPAAGSSGTINDAITIRAWDNTQGPVGGTFDITATGGSTAFSAATDTVAITVNPVNDAPVVDVSQAGVASFFGGVGDQRGTDITYANGELYTVENGPETQSSADAAVVRNFAITGGLTQNFAYNWANGNFFGVAADASQIYAAGWSHPTDGGLTSDGVGGTEVKPILVRFNENGTAGASPAPAIGYTPSNFFAYRGVENHEGVVTAVEGGNTVVYTAGWGQAPAYNGVVHKYSASGALLASASAGTSDANAFDVTVAGSNVFAVGSASSRPALSKYSMALTSPGLFLDTTITGWYGGVAADGSSAVYAVGGRSGGVGGSIDYLVTKYDLNGNILWRSITGGSGNDYLHDVIAVNGRVFAVGQTDSEGAGGNDAVLLELNPATGAVLPKTLYGGAQHDMANALTSDGQKLYVIGESRSFANADNAVGQNDAFLLTYSLGGGATTNEDTPLTISGITVSDVDAGSDAIRVSLSVAHGALALTSTAGLTMVDGVGSDGTLLFDGSQASINAALANSIVYTPTANYNGADALTVTANDLGHNGSGGALSDTELFNITVNPVNDAPVNQPPLANDDDLNALLAPSGAGWEYDAASGHWYKVNEELLSWGEAGYAAALEGGYLATITSAGENAFVNALPANTGDVLGWLGAGDATTEEEWRWLAGPEAGQLFWLGDAGGSAQNGAYTNWNPGEPNDADFGENYLFIWGINHEPVATWNDSDGDNPQYSVFEFNRFTADQPVEIEIAQLLANDTDDNPPPNFDHLNADYSELGAHISADGFIVYDPTISAQLQALRGGEIVTDSFTYTIIDSNNATTQATAYVTVTGVNDAPTFVIYESDPIAFTETGSPIVGDGNLWGVTDPDGDTVTVSVEGVNVIGNDGGHDWSDFLSWLIVPSDPLESGDQFRWSFDSGGDGFGWLAAGETLILEYSLKATDPQGAWAGYYVSANVAIEGIDTAPVISIDNIQQSNNIQPVAPAVFFGGAGDQSGADVAHANGHLYLIQNLPITQTAADASKILTFTTGAGGATQSFSYDWAYGFFGGVTADSNKIYAAGAAHPSDGGLTSDGVGGTEDKSIFVRFNADGTAGASPSPAVGYTATNFFGYRGVEIFEDVLKTTQGGDTVLYAVGGGQPASYYGYVLARYDSNGALLSSAIDPLSVPGFSIARDAVEFNGAIWAVGGTWHSSQGESTNVPVVYTASYDLSSVVTHKDTVGGVNGDFWGAAVIGSYLYAVGGVSANGGDYIAAKYDASGNVVWSRTWGGSGADMLASAVALNDRLFVVGSTTASGNTDAVLMEIDPSNGDVLSTATFGGAQNDAANSITTDGTFLYIAGDTRSFDAGGNSVGQNDAFLLTYGISTTLFGVEVSDVDVGVSDLFQVAVTAEHGSLAMANSTFNAADADPLADRMEFNDVLLSDINAGLAEGVVYTNPAYQAGLVDKVTLTVTDQHGATDSMNFIFNVFGENGVALQGTNDKDALFGTGNDDDFTGGAGADTFIFMNQLNGTGQDSIADFVSGQDKIAFYGMFNDYNAFVASGALANPESNVIDLGGENAITLVDVQVGILTQNDFVFHA